jgi:hypothetical protein
MYTLEESMKTELVKGTIYQVYFNHHWVIAEYVAHVNTHTVKGIRGSDGATEWKEPASDCWKPMTGGFHFRTFTRGLQVRPVTPETLADIIRIQSELERLKLERLAAMAELRSLCD